MRTSLVACGLVPLTLVALPACSSSSNTPAATVTVGPATPGQASADASDSAKVEAYCKKVDDFVAKAQAAQASPNAQTAQELAAEAKQLGVEAAQLVAAVIQNPTLVPRVNECSQKVQGAQTGG